MEEYNADYGMKLDESRIIAVLDPLRRKMNTYRTIMVIAILCVFFFGGMINTVFSPLIQIGGMVTAIVVGTLHFKVSKEYANDYKQLISKYVLQDYFDDAKYYPLRGFTKEEFKEAHLIRWRNDFSYHAEDLIDGRYKDVEFKQSDIKITHESGSGKNRHTVVDVNGRLTRFQYEKDIRGRILIATDVRNAVLEQGIPKVEMEDVEFNKQFDIYATDAHSVYYLLTPHFMEYLKRLRSIDRTLYISFDGKELYVLRSGKGGIFEPPSGRLDVREEVEKNRRELDEIRKLIEVLKLDR